MSNFPNINPDYSASGKVTPKVSRVQFGDGYMQRVGDGLNSLPRTWTLQFKQSEANANTIESFLATCGGISSFTWTPPTGTTGKWITAEDGWSRTIEETSHVISVTFQEVFE